MGKRKVLDMILVIGALLLAVLGLVDFIITIMNNIGNLFHALVYLASAFVMIVLIIRVLLLAKNAGDGNKHILSKEDVDSIKDKLKE